MERARVRASISVAWCLAILPATFHAGAAATPTPSTAAAAELVAVFVPDQPDPAPSSVSLAQGFATGDMVTVEVDVTDVSDVYGGAFHVTFDPSIAAYVGHAPGSILETGGQQVLYLVSESSPGRLIVAVSRLGAVPGADVVGTQPLIGLTFLVLAAGTSRVDFENQALLDSSATPIPGLGWFGGSLLADSGCPATLAAGDAPGAQSTLVTLYRFRDLVLARSERGRSYRELYYRHAEEAFRMMLGDPELRARGQQLLHRMLPAIEAANGARATTLGADDLGRIGDLLDRVAARASPALRRDVQALRSGLDRHALSRLLEAAAAED